MCRLCVSFLESFQSSGPSWGQFIEQEFLNREKCGNDTDSPPEIQIRCNLSRRSSCCWSEERWKELAAFEMCCDGRIMRSTIKEGFDGVFGGICTLAATLPSNTEEPKSGSVPEIDGINRICEHKIQLVGFFCDSSREALSTRHVLIPPRDNDLTSWFRNMLTMPTSCSQYLNVLRSLRSVDDLDDNAAIALGDDKSGSTSVVLENYFKDAANEVFADESLDSKGEIRVNRGFGIELEGMMLAAQPSMSGHWTKIREIKGVLQKMMACDETSMAHRIAKVMLQWEFGNDSQVKHSPMKAGIYVYNAWKVSNALTWNGAPWKGAESSTNTQGNPETVQETDLEARLVDSWARVLLDIPLSEGDPLNETLDRLWAVPIEVKSPPPPFELNFCTEEEDIKISDDQQTRSERTEILGASRVNKISGDKQILYLLSFLKQLGFANPSVGLHGHANAALHVHVNVNSTKGAGVPLSSKEILTVWLWWVRFERITKRFGRPWMWRDRSSTPTFSSGPEWSWNEHIHEQGHHEGVYKQNAKHRSMDKQNKDMNPVFNQDNPLSNQDNPVAKQDDMNCTGTKQMQTSSPTVSTTTESDPDSDEDCDREPHKSEYHMQYGYGHRPLSMDEHHDYFPRTKFPSGSCHFDGRAYFRSICEAHQQQVYEAHPQVCEGHQHVCGPYQRDQPTYKGFPNERDNLLTEVDPFDSVLNCAEEILGRDCSMNLTAVKKYGTIEFRGLHANQDATLITRWAHFCVCFVEVFKHKTDEIFGSGGLLTGESDESSGLFRSDGSGKRSQSQQRFEKWQHECQQRFEKWQEQGSLRELRSLLENHVPKVHFDYLIHHAGASFEV